MTFKTHKRDWEDLAKVDPRWAIFSDPSRKYGKWDTDAFFQTGETDVAALMEVAERLGVPAARESALDFGCGIGRLTRALKRRFARCVGVDISSEMVRQAKDANPDCEFIANAKTSLPLPDATFDLVYTKYVLQHLPDKGLVTAYVRELVRVLKPGGLLVFQIRTALSFKAGLQAGRRLYALLRVMGLPRAFIYERLRLNPIRVIVVSEAEMTAFLGGMNVRVLEIERYEVSSGAGVTYYVTKCNSPVPSVS